MTRLFVGVLISFGFCQLGYAANLKNCYTFNYGSQAIWKCSYQKKMPQTDASLTPYPVHEFQLQLYVSPNDDPLSTTYSFRPIDLKYSDLKDSELEEVRSIFEPLKIEADNSDHYCGSLGSSNVDVKKLAAKGKGILVISSKDSKVHEDQQKALVYLPKTQVLHVLIGNGNPVPNLIPFRLDSMISVQCQAEGAKEIEPKPRKRQAKKEVLLSQNEERNNSYRKEYRKIRLQAQMNAENLICDFCYASQTSEFRKIQHRDQEITFCNSCGISYGKMLRNSEESATRSLEALSSVSEVSQSTAPKPVDRKRTHETDSDSSLNPALNPSLTPSLNPSLKWMKIENILNRSEGPSGQ